MPESVASLSRTCASIARVSSASFTCRAALPQGVARSSTTAPQYRAPSRVLVPFLCHARHPKILGCPALRRPIRSATPLLPAMLLQYRAGRYYDLFMRNFSPRPVVRNRRSVGAPAAAMQAPGNPVKKLNLIHIGVDTWVLMDRRIRQLFLSARLMLTGSLPKARFSEVVCRSPAHHSLPPVDLHRQTGSFPSDLIEQPDDQVKIRGLHQMYAEDVTFSETLPKPGTPGYRLGPLPPVQARQEFSTRLRLLALGPRPGAGRIRKPGLAPPSACPTTLTLLKKTGLATCSIS